MESIPVDKISQELSQANRNNGYLLQLLNKGAESGGFNFLDEENVIAIRTLTRSMCDVSSFFYHQYANNSKFPAAPLKSIEFDVSETSPLTDSVHNSDVTSRDRVAYEPSSSHWVSEFGEEVMEQRCPSHRNSSHNQQSSLLQDKSNKRKSGDVNEHELSNRRIQKFRDCNLGNCNDNMDEMTSITQVMEYLSIRDKYDSHSYSGKCDPAGLQKLIEDVIGGCNDGGNCPYYAQSLVILEHTSSSVSIDSSKSSNNSASTTSSKLSLANFFEECIVLKMVVIERPRDKCQLYVSEDLGQFFHFACPTISIPQMFHSIKAKNNQRLRLLFVPRSCKVYVSEKLCVFNEIDKSLYSNKIVDNQSLTSIIERSGMNSNTSNKSIAEKRSGKSVTIALQTMYSHQQHKARYCMLSHSVPFVPTVKNHPKEIRGSIVSAYSISCQVLSSEISLTERKHPFSLDSLTTTDEEKRVRLCLRNDLLKELMRDDLDDHVNPDMMFEACTVQQTGTLGFHRDVMNCPSLDKTVAFHVPDTTQSQSCLSFLYYSRKCVGDYSSRMDAITTYVTDPNSCQLTVLCLKALLEVKGIFNYQGSLFEHEDCLNDLAETYEGNTKHSCADISAFSGLSCFKHGAAFDKMGYYSIFVNIFLTFFYLKLVTNDDDAISLCIYFGLLCNGTSNLAAVLKDVYDNIDFAKDWSAKKKDSTRLFRLLLILEKRRRSKDSKPGMYGCCKLPRFQYANYSASVIEEADMVHGYVKDFLLRKGTKKDKNVNCQHSELYQTLASIKGIGPLSFNQFWHSLCLCGLLPMDCVQATAVAPGSGPAKLIQTYYPNSKSAEALLSKMHDVKSTISNLGINRISDFFLENMMCELWRLGNKTKLATKSMKAEDRKTAFLSLDFNKALRESAPTKNPDIYYLNPFTDEYQNLFRVMDKQLTMRPSFLRNCNGSSSIVRCNISYCAKTGATHVDWTGALFRKGEISPSECFV